MAEWSIALVLKTNVPQGTVGSNPTPSALDTGYRQTRLLQYLQHTKTASNEAVFVCEVSSLIYIKLEHHA